MSNKPEFKIKYISDEKTPSLEEMVAVGDELERGESQQDKPLPDSQDKNRHWINRVPVRSITRIRLIEASDRIGKLYEQFAGMVLDDVMSNFMPPDENEPNDERYVMWKLAVIEREGRLSDEAYHAAAICAKHPTPAAMESLYDLCDRINLDPQQLIDEVRNDTYKQVVAESLPELSSKRDNCKRFIMDFTRDAGNEIAASTVFEAGLKAGFTEGMVRKVSRELGWIPFKHSSRWYWKRTAIAKLASSKVSSSS